MKEKSVKNRKKAVRDTSKYQLIVHLAKEQRVKPEGILKMTPKELAGMIDDSCREIAIRYLNKNRKRMAAYDLAFPGMKGPMGRLALVTGVDKHLAKSGKTRADIFWPVRGRNYTRRNIVQVNADVLEIRKTLERLQEMVPQPKAKAGKGAKKQK